jgi:lipopolysaccharide biosynthesis glycosyltransferase
MNIDIQKEKITVVCASDDNYAMPLTVAVCSILKNLDPQRHLNLYILDGGISKKNKKNILYSLTSKKCSILFFNTKGCFKEINIPEQFTESIFHRLLIPELLPKDIHKAIYLDCDLLVLSDLGELWDREIGDWHLLAAQDYYYPYIKLGLRNYEELGIPALCKYFNSGVLVINLDKWRELNTSARVSEYIVKPRNYTIFGDQEALNAVLWKEWGELDPKWNQQVILINLLENFEWVNALKARVGEDRYHDIVTNPFIKHFTSPRKPWQFYNHPDKLLFYQYLDMTAWKGWRYTLINVWSSKLYGKMWRLFHKLKF